MSGFDDFVPEVGKILELTSGVNGTVHRPDVERYLLLGVSGKAVVRTSWSNVEELSPPAFDKMSKRQPPRVNLESEKVIEHRDLDPSSLGAHPGRCSMCSVTPGTVFCTVCGGTGRIGIGEEVTPCRACDSGKLVCPVCDGAKKTVRVKMRYNRDQPTPFARAFVPEPADSFRAALFDFLKAQPTVPACLKLDLDDEFTSRDAYRGRRGDFEYRNHQLGGALTLARRYVDRAKRLPSVLAIRHVACAWPFAVLHDSGRHLVMMNAHGAARLLASEPG